MHIRPATAADMAAVHDCWLATDFTDPAEYAAMLPLGIAPWWPHLYEHGRLLVAEADGVIVGLAGTQTRGRICYLADCFVRPEWQSHGIAKAPARRQILDIEGRDPQPHGLMRTGR